MVVTTPVSQNTVSNIGLRPFYMQALRPVVAIVLNNIIRPTGRPRLSFRKLQVQFHDMATISHP